MARISALFWDLGGVVLTNAWDRSSRIKAVEKFHLDRDDFEDRHELLLNAFETGQVTLEDYLNRVIFYRQRTFTPEDFKEFMYGESQALADTPAILRQIVSLDQFLLAALNNESLELNEYRIRKFHLRDYFQVFMSSCYLGVRKPDEAIYRQVLHITQRRPEECIFIDDRSLNLECARELGMNTIQFKSPAQLIEDLARSGVTLDGK
ncbi:MAG: HAD family hydrolase [Candidatus Acidiferrales bacterium]